MQTSEIPTVGHLRAIVRVRPFSRSEITLDQHSNRATGPCIRMSGGVVSVQDECVEDEKGFCQEKEREAFNFDDALWSMPPEQFTAASEYASQEVVYRRCGRPALDAAIAGYNTCIFAYGQTGSGKTYTMLGNDGCDPGIAPRLLEDLFAMQHPPTTKATVELTFFEIYNEKVRDFLVPGSKRGEFEVPRIHIHPTKGVVVEGMIRKQVHDSSTALRCFAKGLKERVTRLSGDRLECTSSRGHAVVQVALTQLDAIKGTLRAAVISLVDLAGSQKATRAIVSPDRWGEVMTISRSLTTLRRVIAALVDSSIGNEPSANSSVPNYRDSVLTHVLYDSLGGNSHTQMIATISPHDSNVEETISTLRYALRAKAIVCKAKVNEEKIELLEQAMKDEITLLRSELLAVDSKEAGERIEALLSERHNELEELKESAKEVTALLEQQKSTEP